jgi:endoglucanase
MNRFCLTYLAIVLAFLLLPGCGNHERSGGEDDLAALLLAPPDNAIYLRLNQVGYLPGDEKLALAMTNRECGGEAFTVRLQSDGSVAYTGTVGNDRGRTGRYKHVYELDFSLQSDPGTYVIRLEDADSPPTVIADHAYNSLCPLVLHFFLTQRCGNTGPANHAPCHLNDGFAAGGPRNGLTVDAAGGWHDAGDYMKFMITAGYATCYLLLAYQRHPDVFPAGNPPAVLGEARIGLDWMMKLWDPGNDILYYQVADSSDHDSWRLPEADTAARPVWACESGAGANVAGKAAASMALAAVIWNDPAKPYYDAVLAASYLAAAKEIYQWGALRPEVQPANPADFYNEDHWEDDMALAAAELYRATGTAAYLADSKLYAAQAGDPGSFDIGNMHALMHYEIARLDGTYGATAAGAIRGHLDSALACMEEQPFRTAIAPPGWGSLEDAGNIALAALLYGDLTGDDSYRDIVRSQIDYALGANQWGVCFVNGAGTTWPHHPHHQIAQILDIELSGFWDEGPVRKWDYLSMGPRQLDSPDVYGAFQSNGAVYHDDYEDYVTNEPTISMNAVGVFLASWLVVP